MKIYILNCKLEGSELENLFKLLLILCPNKYSGFVVCDSIK